MQAYQIVHCPNCGSPAERYRYLEQHLTRTQCAQCDYLLITCTQSGQVVEAYAPGLYTHQVKTAGKSLPFGERQVVGSPQLATGRRRL